MSDSTSHRSGRLVGSALIVLAVALGLLLAAYGGYRFGIARSAVLSPQATSQGFLAESLPSPTPPAATATPVPTQAMATVTATTVPTATPTASPTVEKAVPLDEPAAAETLVPGAQLAIGPDSDDPEAMDLAVFFDVWQLIEREFDGELPTDENRVYGAIAGSLEALDDEYTRFIRPEIAARLRDDMDGSVSGIGAIVRPTEEGLVEIVRPIDDQPADLAGLMAGDYIVAVDGQAVSGLQFDEVLLLVRGPAGSAVSLTIVREGEDEPLEFELVRAEFEVPVVEFELLEQDEQTIGYVRLSSFTRSATEELERALDGFLEQGVAGVIFDLRDNGGGFLDQAVEVADLFLADGVVLYERSSSSSELDETFRSEDGDVAEMVPLVVLVNAGSASASEIVAGAIQDNGRALLVGETTFGKGSVQHVHTLADGSELRVTIARWFTPQNRSIGQQGITPDVEVATPDDLGGEDDPQLQRAIEALLAGR